MKVAIIEGGCLCGAIRYEASAEPYHVTHCHCEDCRRASAAAFVTWASFPRDKFRFTGGQPRDLTWAGRLRSFCGQCGTPLTFMSHPDADEIDVTVCSFDHPEQVQPADNIWVEDRLLWTVAAGNLPGHRRKRSDS